MIMHICFAQRRFIFVVMSQVVLDFLALEVGTLHDGRSFRKTA